MHSLLRSLNDMREVEENALHPVVFLEDFCDLRTVAAADVRNDTDPGEIVSIENGVRFSTVNADHCRIENAGFVGMVAQVIEDPFAEHLVECNLSCANAVINLCPGTKLLVTHHERQGTFRSCNVASQRLSQGRQRETT